MPLFVNKSKLFFNSCSIFSILMNLFKYLGTNRNKTLNLRVFLWRSFTITTATTTCLKYLCFYSLTNIRVANSILCFSVKKPIHRQSVIKSIDSYNVKTIKNQTSATRATPRSTSDSVCSSPRRVFLHNQEVPIEPREPNRL